MLDKVMRLVAPHSCCGCNNVGSLLCSYCRNDIVTEAFSQCIVCLTPCAQTDLCKSCINESGLRGGWCLGFRENVLHDVLDAYKFRSARQAGDIISSLLDDRLPLLPQDMTVVPVPTSPAHVRVRGFDHTALIARGFAAKRGLECVRPLRRYSNDTQHFKGRRERLRLDASSLSVSRAVPRTILLVDDVYTTGATIRSCSEMLLQNGAVDIYIALIARQPLDANVDL